MGIFLDDNFNEEDWEGVPDFWIRFVDDIESLDNNDPLVEYDIRTRVTRCRLCDHPLWGDGTEQYVYNPIAEWNHFRLLHDDMVIMVRLRME